MSYQRFLKYKERIFKKEEKKEIIFNNINVLPYPDSSNIYKISFEEKYRSKSFEFTGDKVLIVKYDNNEIKILTER